MSQMTVRTSDDLMRRVKAAAQRDGRSMNDYVTAVLDAATNPDLATDAAQRVRERLGAAGLLAPEGAPRRRPSARAMHSASRAAGKGTPLSELVADSRG